MNSGDVAMMSVLITLIVTSGAVLILRPVAKRLAELPDISDGRELIVHCKMGGRSAKAVALLQARGFTHAKNLTELRLDSR